MIDRLWRLPPMKISSKGRYGLAAMIYIAQLTPTQECVTIIRIAEKLGISKIYLEQVFSLLKRADLVISIKGAQGGYQLAKPSDQITAGNVLRAIETSLFEKTDRSVEDSAIEEAITSLVWNALDQSIATVLDSITLLDLAKEADTYSDGTNYMFYI